MQIQSKTLLLVGSILYIAIGVAVFFFVAISLYNFTISPSEYDIPIVVYAGTILFSSPFIITGIIGFRGLKKRSDPSQEHYFKVSGAVFGFLHSIIFYGMLQNAIIILIPWLVALVPATLYIIGGAKLSKAEGDKPN
jgi:hypothetical protein